MSILLFVGYQTFFTRTPTCNDGVRNGSETGVDCGGSCALICEDQSRLPTLLWSRAFEAAPQFYTAAAYVQNPNIGSGAKRVRYSFRLFDDKNEFVVEREGFVDIPPTQTVPILETSIDVGNRTVARTLFEFTSDPVWVKVPANSLPTLRLAEQKLTADGTRLSANLVNDTLFDANNVTVVAVVFDNAGVARAASKTFIQKVPRQSAEPIIFTWPKGFEGVARAEITILPAF